MTPWIGIGGAILGTVVGWALGLVAKVIDDRNGVDRTLRTSAHVCLDRLLRIQQAADRNDTKQRDDEIFHLGGAMDRYLVSIAAARAKSRRIHMPIHSMMIPVLLEHKIDGIAQAVARLRKALGL